MKTLIIYKSFHRMNTEKVAKAMADALDAKLLKIEDVRQEELAGYDLIGFGSGIYAGKHHKKLIAVVEHMPPMDINVFVFSTYSDFTNQDVNHRRIKEKLTEKGCGIVGEFSCLGAHGGILGLNKDWKGRLSLIGGRNKGHPDEKDLENARRFAKGLLNA